MLRWKAQKMFENRYIKEHLERTYCYKCGTSLEGAKLVTISEAPIAIIAHAICPKCQAESMVTITTAGTGTTPIVTDLKADEIKKFLAAKNVSYDDLLNLHKLLEKESLWKLLQKTEPNSEKNQKN
ncbi:hypothetical protein A3F07_03985 [candidate division WWE3 bacterium RIFCSPHIGHO2_12_FULL_38_15]|uniref:Uncharacterized protein n=1 Tax=candidate division WWE3 bacterium RIFCSPHIGHO2_02_FULL_38_14 TaxID=1802620 RepID=A0A1F4V9T8_UNCKA|nr:MAG: hypothetical protein A3F07_03985 [candidate division WWE3 bacterium RIFCSPHIGHO2_12_FULL_38_15]OGC52705.1 MAG: hypothetical protein A3B64_00825 [candidate division WWE3 bacterium RIFCSPLOWO2_01_FULL_37_24]OGC53899.1 MAG: hypothetical protein A3D91_03880 [candidate division WWE3 bacterium RIFCSPHIGHO2_02_FULL_38_14]HLB51404.1 hypothetical protein [Patescibacteria group bacterium]